MQECWSTDASERPCFETIAGRLKSLQRWRLLRRGLTHLGMIPSRRTQSMPAMVRPEQLDRRRAQPTDDAAGSGSTTGDAALARRVVSAPPAVSPQAAADSIGQQQVPGRAAAALHMGALRAVPPLQLSLPPVPLHGRLGRTSGRGISSIPEMEGETTGVEQMPSLQPSLLSPFTTADAHSSLPVSSTVVDGRCFAIIGLAAQQDEHDALSSVADPQQIADAARVLLVASDLPSCYATHSLFDHGLDGEGNIMAPWSDRATMQH